jgi:tRNA-uridine 2-sulfurtransferase
MTKRTKGIGLLSGGLDSTLAAKVLQEQDIEVLGVTFVTPFFGSQPGIDAGRKIGIETIVIDISDIHFAMLKNPVYGYGSQMNPCIDCHALMLREAGRVMEERGAGFLFTGEVLGQRPMSQRRDSLRSVEKLAGYPDRVLRPLSAKLLPPTIAETGGLVDRELLLDIHGRSRKRQTELAARYGITDYPQPGGGCVLTKEGYANRLRELLRTRPGATARCAELIKWGRVFLLPQKSILVIGRQHSDNVMLRSLAREEDICLKPLGCAGPTGILLPSDNPAEDIGSAAGIIASYSDAPEAEPVRVQWRGGGSAGSVAAASRGRDSFAHMML